MPAFGYENRRKAKLMARKTRQNAGRAERNQRTARASMEVHVSSDNEEIFLKMGDFMTSVWAQS